MNFSFDRVSIGVEFNAKRSSKMPGHNSGVFRWIGYSGYFAYLRMISEDAWEHYDRCQMVTTPEFGEVSFTGQISILHIDGNHDEPQVESDFRHWSQRVLPGGWIVFDDYEWPQGYGPRKVVDRVKQEWSDKIERYFVAGGAVFMKLNGGE